tara:strand:- start:701 stop:1216 length:516 start_codon:yes stop_codon:yes gene_type:complete
MILIIFLTFKNNKINKQFDKYYFYFFLILLSGSFFWFLKSPLYRYGYSFLICTLAFMFAFYCSKFSFLHKKYDLVFSYILVLGIVTIFGKNLIRIYKTDNNYFNYPWPKYHSMDMQNKPTILNKTTLNEKIIFYPKKGKYCMYTRNLCTHYGVDNNLKLLKTNKNYLLFFK